MVNRNAPLLKILYDCVSECNHCASACLEEKDMKLMKDCILLDLDCSSVCEVTAEMIARDSAYAMHLLKVCGDICNACATECEKHAHLAHCKLCADVCRVCAEACEQFAVGSEQLAVGS